MTKIALDPNEHPSENTVAKVANYAVGYVAGESQTTTQNLDDIPHTAIQAAIGELVVNADELDQNTYGQFVDEIRGEALSLIDA